MGALVLFFFLATMASTTQSRWVPNLLMPRLGAPGLHASTAVYCDSWRFSVETNNSIDWSVVPDTCADYVGKYMISPQYYADCDFVVDEAIKYVDSLKLVEIDTWVFDIDETALSNLDYYARPDVPFGSKKRHVSSFYEWVGSAKVPALPSVLRLYKHLIDKKVKIVFLTGSSDAYTKAREDNLKSVGYTTWDKLILRSKDDYDKGLRGAVFKSAKRKELEEKDPKHRIIGNIGDQWSDLIGTNVGNRTFKLPNPMYSSQCYICMLNMLQK